MKYIMEIPGDPPNGIPDDTVVVDFLKYHQLAVESRAHIATQLKSFFALLLAIDSLGKINGYFEDECPDCKYPLGGFPEAVCVNPNCMRSKE